MFVKTEFDYTNFCQPNILKLEESKFCLKTVTYNGNFGYLDHILPASFHCLLLWMLEEAREPSFHRMDDSNGD